ncbi:MAG: FtsW/RodA/SpoVE family cell cycle protein [Brevinematia bacterium]
MDSFLRKELLRDTVYCLSDGRKDRELSCRKAKFYIQMVMISVFSLIVIGLAFVLSTTYSLSLHKFGNPFVLFGRQFLWVVVGIVAMLVFSRIDTSVYGKFVKFILLFGILISILPFIPGVGKARGDAYRWINLGILNISSSEIVKMVLILYISVVLSRKKDKSNFLNVFLPIFVVSVLFFVVVSLQLDVSMAFLVLVSSIVIMYVGGIPPLQVILTVLVSFFFILLFGEKFPYLQNRILAFLDPWSDPFGRGYHSIYMVKSFQNGVFGVGVGNGSIKEKYLPEAHTDSVFAVIGEEAGLIGALVVLTLFTTFFYYSLKLAVEVEDLYRSSLIVGFSTVISVWAIVNIIVNIGLLPPTGTNLPLLSYGGANMVTSLAGVGIIYRCYREFSTCRKDT